MGSVAEQSRTLNRSVTVISDFVLTQKSNELEEETFIEIFPFWWVKSGYIP